jgi:hypothetical protein
MCISRVAFKGKKAQSVLVKNPQTPVFKFRVGGPFYKFGTANLAGEDKRKKVCGSLFVKKLMGGCN